MSPARGAQSLGLQKLPLGHWVMGRQVHRQGLIRGQNGLSQWPCPVPTGGSREEEGVDASIMHGLWTPTETPARLFQLHCISGLWCGGEGMPQAASNLLSLLCGLCSSQIFMPMPTRFPLSDSTSNWLFAPAQPSYTVMTDSRF